MHGGVLVKDLNEGENVEAVAAGFANLQKHIETMQNFQVPVVVCVNEFVSDTEAEEPVVLDKCAEVGVVCVKSSVWANGGQGGLDLADAVVTAIDGNDQEFKATYAYEETNLEEKARAIVQKVYGGRDVVFSKKAQNQMRRFEKNGWGNLPICMAKTQYSLSDDPKSLGRPEDFDVTVRELVPKIGAGFIVALTGDVLTMPGLPKHPAAMGMDIKKDGEITGLF